MLKDTIKGGQCLVDFLFVVGCAGVEATTGKRYQAFRHIRRAHMFHLGFAFRGFMQDGGNGPGFCPVDAEMHGTNRFQVTYGALIEGNEGQIMLLISA